jgi:hypothetical protein
VFIALGGSAWAISANSVGSKQIKPNAVRSSDVKNGQVKAADLAGTALDAEATHLVGEAGEPAFLNNWVNSDTVNFRPAGYFKDRFGVVHLQGMVEDGTGSQIFQLPAGYTSGKGQYFAASLPGNPAVGEIVVSFNGTVSRNDAVLPSEAISLEGISFRVP